MFETTDVRNVIASSDSVFYDEEEPGFFVGTDGYGMTLTDPETGEFADFAIQITKL